MQRRKRIQRNKTHKYRTYNKQAIKALRTTKPSSNAHRSIHKASRKLRTKKVQAHLSNPIRPPRKPSQK